MTYWAEGNSCGINYIGVRHVCILLTTSAQSNLTLLLSCYTNTRFWISQQPEYTVLLFHGTKSHWLSETVFQNPSYKESISKFPNLLLCTIGYWLSKISSYLVINFILLDNCRVHSSLYTINLLYQGMKARFPLPLFIYSPVFRHTSFSYKFV